MKRIALKLSSLLMLFSINAISMSTLQVLIGSDTVFVPQGWDSNDREVQIYVKGEFPNTCFRRPTGTVTLKDDNKIVISLTAAKIVDPNVLCIMARIPYMVPVALGQLKEGSYNIEINPATDWEKKSSISVESPSAESIDNFTYANVTDVYGDPDTNDIIIEGYHPSSCMDFQGIEVRPNASLDTFSILPIIKQVKAECDTVIKPFVERVTLPMGTKKEVLVHVRKIDGRSINYLFRN